MHHFEENQQNFWIPGCQIHKTIEIHSSKTLLLLPFSYSNVCKTRLSGQLFLLHSQLPWHEDLWISPLVSVSHRLHRHLTPGRSHSPGRPALSVKLAKRITRKPFQVQRRVQVPVDHSPTDETVIGAVLEGHALFDIPTTRTAFGRRKPARSNKEFPSRIGYFRFQEL